MEVVLDYGNFVEPILNQRSLIETASNYPESFEDHFGLAEPVLNRHNLAEIALNYSNSSDLV